MMKLGVCENWRTCWYAVPNWQQMWSAVESGSLGLSLDGNW